MWGFIGVATFPVIVTGVLYLLDKKTNFGKLSYPAKQAIYGLVFGGLAVIATEFGIDVGGAIINTRDASVLAGGLIFGAPAGVLAGVIGGVERYLCVFWGGGTYTRLACSISTLLAGILGALLRKYLFDDKRPSLLYALAIGLAVEVLHMLMVFITNMSDIATDFTFVQTCAVPMISANSLALMLSVAVVSFISKEKIAYKGKHIQISAIVQRWMLYCMIVAFLLTCIFTYVLQSNIAKADIDELLRLSVDDVMTDVQMSSNQDLASLNKHKIKTLSDAIQNRHIGKSGYLLVADNEGEILAGRYSGIKIKDKNLGVFLFDDTNENKSMLVNVFGEKAYCMYKYQGGFYYIGVLSESEATFAKEISIYMMAFMEIVIFASLFILIYFSIKTIVVDNIKNVNDSLKKITEGNLDVVVDVRTSSEFVSLSNDINETVDTLKQLIEEAAASIDRELAFAKVIQESSLPSQFPPFPEKKEIDIFASMHAAKEVGGDFYDFYLIDDDHLAFLVADVSGKGITGAMFMMRAKALIKSFAERGGDVAEILTRVNDALCEGNEAEMFVTCFMCILDISNGKIEFANAGHNPPLIRHKDGTFEYFKSRPGFVLGGMNDIKYRKGEIDFARGDTIFLYTDGVTEATDESNVLYGEERLSKILNSVTLENIIGENNVGAFDSIDAKVSKAERLCSAVKDDVDSFVGNAPQFDDITMLALRFCEPEQNIKSVSDDSRKDKVQIDMLNQTSMENDSEIVVPATVENIETVTRFIDAKLESLDCPMKAQAQIDVAIDEILGNIALYAYKNDDEFDNSNASVTVRLEFEADTRAFTITFIDNGIPYNPLKNEDPDTTLEADEREIGGLGVFLVKKTMDDVSYEYKDSQNVLRIKKHI